MRFEGRQRREGARLRLHIDHEWHLARCGIFERTPQVLCRLDAARIAAAGASDRHVVDRPEMADIGVRAKATFLGIDLESQFPIIEHDDGKTNSMALRGLQFGPAVGEAAIPRKADDAFAGSCELGANGHRYAPAEACKAARRQKSRARFGAGDVLHEPDRGITCVCHPDDVAIEPCQFAEYALRPHGCVRGMGIGRDLFDMILARLLEYGCEFGEPLARRAWEINRQLLGEDHPTTLADAAAYAGLLDGLERYAESEPIYRRAMEGFTALYGEEHYEIAVNLNNLANVRNALGDPQQAEALFHRAIVIKEKILGPDHPDTGLSLNNLGVMLSQQGRVAEARRLFRRALRIFRRSLGAGHPKTDLARVNLAALRTPRGEH